MPVKENVDVIIYRVRENGLEVFLVDPANGSEGEGGQLATPASQGSQLDRFPAHSIELDPVTNAEGQARRAIAIEADWHEIPSLRALMYEDYRVAKKAKFHLKTFVADFEKGAYVAIKEAAKRVMPEQYAFLKELKDIIADKNQANSI